MTLLKIAIFGAVFGLLSLRAFAEDGFIRPSDVELKKKLSPLQYQVVRQNGTEPPFDNAYWNNHASGIYVDIVSGEALFSSLDKFDSGTGWPSFTRPLADENIVEKKDRSLFLVRTEVRSRLADSHLGHVFDDGPAPTGKRYCINSAALRFIAAEKLESEGYEKFAALFTGKTADKALATFAGGCFWCMEKPFDELQGVLRTTVGYTGGDSENPTYKEVSDGWTGHAEAIEIEYNPGLISFEQLLTVFWRNIDPTVKDRQFCDWGNQYRSAIFYHNEQQRQAAANELSKLRQKFGDRPLYTEIVPAKAFYPAEDYHQDYYKKNPLRYKFYRQRCGRDQRLQELWEEK